MGYFIRIGKMAVNPRNITAICKDTHPHGPSFSMYAINSSIPWWFSKRDSPDEYQDLKSLFNGARYPAPSEYRDRPNLDPAAQWWLEERNEVAGVDEDQRGTGRSPC